MTCNREEHRKKMTDHSDIKRKKDLIVTILEVYNSI